MNVITLLKLFVSLVILAVSAQMLYTWYGAFIVGNYAMTAGPLLVFVGSVFPIVVVLMATGIITKIFLNGNTNV